MNNRVAIYAFDQDGVAVTGSVPTFSVFSTVRFGGAFSATQLNGDEVFFTRYFPKGGMYKVRLVYSKNSNYAKVDIGLDSNGASNIVSQFDMYAAGSSFGNVYETTIEIPRGYHDIHIKANGKNASSSNYASVFQLIAFDLVQEYPEGLYKDDRPAQINQGSMVLLGKHTAAVAESTFTFNLANADLINAYSEIIVTYDLDSTASFALQMVINGLSSNYYQNGYSAIGGTVAALNLSAQAQFQLASTSVITAGGQAINGKASITGANGSGYNLRLNWFCGSGSIGEARGSGTLTNTVATPQSVTSIQIKTSTSTWAIGSQISVYGVKRL